MTFLSWSKGWKTYVTVVVGISEGIAGALGYQTPGWLYWITGFAGLGFHRMAISDQAELTAESIRNLVNSVLTQVTIPDVATVAVGVGSSVKVDNGSTVTVGAPSPSNQNEAEEEQETAALNKFQVKPADK